MEHTWDKFVRKIRIKAPVEQVYLAWTDCAEITQWFLAYCAGDGHSTQHFKPGESFCWEWYNYPNRTSLKILEANGRDQINFEFGLGMEVHIVLKEEGEFTVITLTQINIPTSEADRFHYHIGCRQAWSTWLLNLKAYLEHGITLHDKSLGDRPDLFDFVNT